MKTLSALFVLTLLVLLPSSALAWKAGSCDGKVIGMRKNTTFTIDSCNIPFGSERYKAVADAAAAWNRIAGVHDRFQLVMKDHGCKIQDKNTIVFVDPAEIDGKAGMTQFFEKDCGWLDANDGARYNFVIAIATNVALRPSTPTDTHQSVRQVLFHEMGHALGAEHDVRGEPNMTWNPANAPRFGDRPVTGYPRAPHAEGYMPDDIQFALEYHADGTYVEYDMAAGAQWWDPSINGGEGVPLNPPGETTLCPGDSTDVVFSHWITGGRPFSCARNDSAQAWFVLTNLAETTTPSAYDRRLATWELCGEPGEYFRNQTRITIPGDVKPGTYSVALAIDPENRYRETSENNNVVFLGKRIKVVLCKPIITVPISPIRFF